MTLRKCYQRVNESDEMPSIIRIPILFLSAIIFQGILYMDPTERRYKIATTLGFTGAFWASFNWAVSRSLVVGHSLNFLVNGHLWVLLKKFDVVYTSDERFKQWSDDLRKAGRNSSSIAAVVACGSISRGDRTPYSDLDVRVIRKPGVFNGLDAAFTVMIFRLKALIEIFPLDIYLLDGRKNVSVFKEHEDPVVLVDKEGWFDEDDR